MSWSIETRPGWVCISSPVPFLSAAAASWPERAGTQSAPDENYRIEHAWQSSATLYLRQGNRFFSLTDSDAQPVECSYKNALRWEGYLNMDAWEILPCVVLPVEATRLAATLFTARAPALDAFEWAGGMYCVPRALRTRPMNYLFADPGEMIVSERGVEPLWSTPQLTCLTWSESALVAVGQTAYRLLPDGTVRRARANEIGKLARAQFSALAELRGCTHTMERIAFRENVPINQDVTILQGSLANHELIDGQIGYTVAESGATALSTAPLSVYPERNSQRVEDKSGTWYLTTLDMGDVIVLRSGVYQVKW